MKPSGAGRALSPGRPQWVIKTMYDRTKCREIRAVGVEGVMGATAARNLRALLWTPGLWLQCYRLSVRLWALGELRHSQGTGEAAGSEVPSAGVQHTCRLRARDEHGQDQPGGGHFPR